MSVALSGQKTGIFYYWKQHFRSVGSLIAREMTTRFGSKPGGYLWAIFDPMGHIALLGLLREALNRTPPMGSSVIMFIASGYLGYSFYNSMQAYLSSSVSANRALLLYPVVAPIDTVVARYSLQMLTCVLVCIAVVQIVLRLEGGVPAQYDWASLFLAAISGSGLALGVSMTNIALFARWPLYEKLFGILTRPLFFLSGVFVLPDEIGHPYVDYLLWNPIVHVVMLFRCGFYPMYKAELLDNQYLFMCSASSLFIGVTTFTFYAKSIRNDD